MNGKIEQDPECITAPGQPFRREWSDICRLLLALGLLSYLTGGRRADDFAPGEHARACPAPAALLAVFGHHAALLCDSDTGGERLVRSQVRGMI
jgi:hypothetical protein